MGLLNDIYDSADRMKRIKDHEDKQAAAKALAKKRLQEKQASKEKDKDNFSLF